MSELRKVFVGVTSLTDANGNIKPTSVIWEDGRQYEIDQIEDVRKAVSLKVGGTGTRYTCRIAGKSVYLFYESPRWFMEGRKTTLETTRHERRGGE